MTDSSRPGSRATLLAFALMIIVLAAGCASTSPQVQRRQAPYSTGLQAWVALGSEGPLARAIVTDPQASCPALEVTGESGSRTLPMKVRSERQTDFEILVCEAAIPQSSVSASIMGIALPLPPRDLKRIAVIGDTGCRINFDKNKNQYNVQDCKNDWPFAKIARKVADEQPDVVIHVGDYHYREVPCPENKQKECGGSPYGNNWPTWQADFFTPAAPLLQAAPWVFVRGNHEDCKRAGWGWLRLLDLGPLPSVDCNENPAPYAVKLPGLQLLVLNTSAAGAEPASFYKTAYEEINQLAAASSEPSWLLSHHPLWAFVQPENKPLIPLTEKLQEASGNNLDANVKLVLAGHIHLFEALAFAPSPPRAPSIVAGMSGTELDPKIETPLVDQPIAGTTVSQASTSNQFAYAILEPKDKGWRMTVHDVNGKAVMVCEIAGEALGCKGM